MFWLVDVVVGGWFQLESPIIRFDSLLGLLAAFFQESHDLEGLYLLGRQLLLDIVSRNITVQPLSVRNKELAIEITSALATHFHHRQLRLIREALRHIAIHVATMHYTHWRCGHLDVGEGRGEYKELIGR